MTAVGIACCAMWLAVVVAGVLCMRREGQHQADDCDCPACTIRAGARR